MSRKVSITVVNINTKAIAKLLSSYGPGSRLQKFIDSKVYKHSEEFTPKATTALEKSPIAIENQKKAPFGWGRILYSIYGRKDGRNTWNDTASKFQGRPKRGPFWTKRMLDEGGAEKLKLNIERFIKKFGNV